MNKKIIAGVVLIVLLVLGWYAVSERNDVPTVENETPEKNTGDMAVSGMRVEENAVVVSEQRPDTTITAAQVYLSAPGYLVIHEDANGAPGAILGSSALLQAGQNDKVNVTLARSARHGEKLYAMLHNERGGNTTFDSAVDTHVESRLGGPIFGWFEVKTDAEENVEITL